MQPFATCQTSTQKRLLFIILLILVHAGDGNNPLSASSVTDNTNIVKNPYRPRDHIVNPHNFTYILNPGYSVCGDINNINDNNNKNNNNSVYLFVYVHSGPTKYQRRIVIRETWATRTLFPDLRLVFMIGKSLNAGIMKAIEYENELYQDI